MPIDNTMPLFWNVARMPLAAPRCVAGTAFMIAAEFGDANKPEPTPDKAISAAKAG